MRPILAALVLTLPVAACATPYKPPSEPSPPEWTGASGMRRVGPTTYSTGVVRTGAVVAAMPVAYVRTGLLADEVKLMTAYGGTMRLPAGSKAYAANYTLVVRQPSRPVHQVQPTGGPIEWCIIAQNGFDGISGEQTACAFWERADRARYMHDYTEGRLPFEPAITVGSASGMPGPVPRIIEQPVEFGLELTRQLKVHKVDGRRLVLHVVLTDGARERVLDEKTFNWSGGGYVAEEGLEFDKVADDPTAVRVTIEPWRGDWRGPAGGGDR